MGHLKGCEASNRVCAGRSRSQNSYRPAGQFDRINSTETEPDRITAKRPTFAEDFMLEHSHSGLLIALMGSAATYASTSREKHESTQHYGFPS